MNAPLLNLCATMLAGLLSSVCLVVQAAEPLTPEQQLSDNQQIVLAPEQPFAGKSQIEWAENWWQWASSMSKAQSPLRDVTGKSCDVNQTGNVWFIGGATGGGKVSRSCTIPAGKALFMPLITTMFYGNGDCKKARANAAATSDRLAYASFELDGVASNDLSRYRQASTGCFALHPNESDSANGSGSGIQAATDGYWIMLKPLAPGEHVLKFTAGFDRPAEYFGQMKQDVVYRLTVLAP